ncbi:unnamed protein product [Paramecium sonneborni]|uniref:Uncharacterized protein n=1 Tax=Paramecium sonneborni TaxID=65129 RepID=A0A8S1R092_9CILI|nr:unnamed protein product [Paramecium sonneborni]
MGTVIIGKCQCQCYINYVSCDCTFQENEVKTKSRTNRFTENVEKRNKIKNKSPGDSTEKLSRFSSTRKPSSRSSSLKSKYLLSNECNIQTDESSQTRIKRKPKIIQQFVKSTKFYNFAEYTLKSQSVIHQQHISEHKEHKKSAQSSQISQIVQSNRPLKTDNNKEEQYDYRPFKKANKYQQLFFK